MEQQPRIFSKIQIIWIRMKPIIFSHHPNCPKYENDIYRIKNIRFCTGCFLAYPIMQIFLSILLVESIFSSFQQKDLFQIGCFCAFGYIFLKLPFANRKSLQYFSKILVGIGGAFILASYHKLPWDDESIKFLRFFTLFIVVNLHIITRGLAFYRICNKCEYKFKWETCPGMKECFIDKNIDNIENKIEQNDEISNENLF